MAAAVLKEAGWKVHHLGVTSTEEVADFANHYDIGVVVLTSATDQGRSTARAMIAELAVRNHGDHERTGRTTCTISRGCRSSSMNVLLVHAGATLVMVGRSGSCRSQ